jgi:methylmalonyl-CoA/ethylmalonyl-CoA epimerase
MIGRLNHVAIVVPDLDAAAAFYRDMLGAEVSPGRDLPEHGVRVAFVTLPNSKVELMTPLGDASPVRPFLDRNPGGGMHHLCYEVEDILSARDRLRASGLRVLFLHPKDGFGTLIELEEVRAGAAAPGHLFPEPDGGATSL